MPIGAKPIGAETNDERICRSVHAKVADVEDLGGRGVDGGTTFVAEYFSSGVP